MRLLICGSRNWKHKDIVKHCIQYYLKDQIVDCIIEGEARGADTFAREIAEELSIPVLKFPAQWEKFGKAAGPIRNKQMLDEGKPTFVLAFHNDIKESKGTKNMIRISRKAGISGKLVGCIAKDKKSRGKVLEEW